MKWGSPKTVPRSQPSQKLYNPRISQKLTNVWTLISNAILSRSSFKTKRFAANSLFVLPHAARIEGNDVVEPLGQRRHLVCFVPRQYAQIMGTSGSRTPLLIVRQHQKTSFVVTALLFRSFHAAKPKKLIQFCFQSIIFLPRGATANAMQSSLVVITFRIDILIATRIGQEPSLIVESVFLRTRANGNFRGEIFQVPVVLQPAVT